jgi:hypothetical protein
MSAPNRKLRYVVPNLDLPAMPGTREVRFASAASKQPDSQARATFGPATYYRQGVLVPGGRPKRPPRD